MQLDGESVPFQFTGNSLQSGAEVLLLMAFEQGQTRVLSWQSHDECTTNLTHHEIELSGTVSVGSENSTIDIGEDGALCGFAGYPLQSRVLCDTQLEACTLHRTNHGPLFSDYVLLQRFAGNR